MPLPPKRASTVSPFLVALAAWICPGTGYLLIKQQARGLTIGITIFLLFFSGLLIGGVRCLEVPGYNAHGDQLYSWTQPESARTPDGERVVRQVARTGPKPTGNTDDIRDEGWTLTKRPFDEVRAKPWSIAQIMMGPIDVLCDMWSVSLAQPVDPANPAGERIGARSHSRVNEFGVLFTAVAGMLNLLAIIDSAHRASHAEVE
jgi:hypothetical protein